MEALIYQEITPDEVLNPHGGKTHKKFYPTKHRRDRKSTLQRINSLRKWGKMSHKEAFNKYCEVNANAPSVKTLEADRLFIQKRKDRLEKVANILLIFYMEIRKKDEPITQDKYIDAKHKWEVENKAWLELKKIYENPQSLA
jgi:hypothetical protein